MDSHVYHVVSPVGTPVPKEKQCLAPRLDTLESKTVCEVWNAGFAGETSFPIIEKLLRERYPGVKVVPYTDLPLTTIASMHSSTKAKMLESVRSAFLAKGCDAVISGNGG